MGGKKLHWVTIEIGVNATDSDEAIRTVNNILIGESGDDCSWLIHKADKDDRNITVQQHIDQKKK